MAEKYTKKSRYQSRYSPGKYVTAAQYIVEIMCEKNAARDGRDLPAKFWSLPEWAKFFRNQIPAANKLLDKYHAEAIIAALRDKKTWSCYSLRAPFLIPHIEKQQKILEGKAKQPKKEVEKRHEIPDNIYKKKRVGQFKKNIIDILEEEELDGQKEEGGG